MLFLLFNSNRIWTPVILILIHTPIFDFPDRHREKLLHVKMGGCRRTGASPGGGGHRGARRGELDGAVLKEHGPVQEGD